MAGLGVAAVAGTAMGAGDSIPRSELGWDAQKKEYTLPPLPYAYDALEPHIDEQTMRLHHDKHHAGYVRGLNRALAALAGIRSGEVDASLIKHWSRELSFHGSGHVNHLLFWAGMAPAGEGGGGEPTGALAEAIARDFGSFQAFTAQFQAAAGAVEGSGWAWLVHEPLADRLMVIQMEKHQDLTVSGVNPILGIDVWEHAYYLRYQNRRKAYVKAFSNVINWTRADDLLARSRA